MLRFATGFDYYTNLLRRWDITIGSPSVSASGGRAGTAGLSFGGDGRAVKKNLGAQLTTIYTGFAVKVTAGGNDLVSWHDNGSPQASVRVNSDGTFQVWRGWAGSGTLIGTSTYAVPFGAYIYVEVLLVISNGAGVVTLLVDEVEKYSLTAIDTANTTTTYATQLCFGNFGASFGGSTGTFLVDDVYLCDESGTENTTFLGDVHLEARRPIGPGTYTEFGLGGTTPAATNWESQDEAADNEEVDYVIDTVPGSRDSYEFGALTATVGTIPAVLVHNRVRKEQGGPRTFAALARTAGVDLLGPEQGMSTEYFTWPTIYELAPGGGAWDIAGVNATEFGQQLVA